MALQTFHRCRLALCVFCLVTVDAGAGSGRGIVKYGLEFRLHGRHGCGRMARTTRLLRRIGGVLRAAGMMAC